MSRSTAPIALIAAIGNPEAQYRQTRHNAGFWLADVIAEDRGLSWRNSSVVAGRICEIELADQRLRLYKSGLSMNISGRAIARLVKYYRVAANQVLVLQDELAFVPGLVRMKFAGGAGGHNGIKSIVELMGTADFWRCRIGIGQPSGPMAHKDYVLAKPSDAQTECILAACQYFSAQLPLFVGEQRERALTAIHSFSSALAGSDGGTQI